MTIKLALATNDRLTVYTHFGQADVFQIVEVDDDDSYSFAETRNITPACAGGSHNENAFDAIIEKIADCDAVVVGKIGQGAADYVIRKNIRVFEAPGVIEQIVPIISKMIRES
jgi:predicted Fe-Mo cluster-binding NifX family protein